MKRPTKLSSPEDQKPSIISSDGQGLPWHSQLLSSPSEPGVYWFSDADDTVLYVGKAKNLKKRLTSYKHFNRLTSRIQSMVTTASRISWHVLESELEALLTEAELIRTHQPSYNVLLKDDKSPLYIHITDEEFPRVTTKRKKEIVSKQPKGTILGPFPSGYKVKEVLKLVRPIFPWCNRAATDTNKTCFYYHLDLCPGACAGEVSAKDYQEQIKHLILFLRGKKTDLLKHLKQEMKEHSANQQFEKAAEIRDTIQLIESVVHQKKKLRPNITLPQIQAHSIDEQLIRLRGLLADHLAVPRDYELTRIEGYDVSNIQGTHPTVAQVTFTDGQPDLGEYRLYNIRTLKTPNDFAMLREAIIRRQNHPEWELPNLVIIDGGKGQLKSALSVWKWSSPVISIAKNPDRIIIPNIPFTQNEPITMKTTIKYHVLKLEPGHPALTLAQRIRDEAHRFSKKQHTRLRQKNLFQ